MHRFSFLLFPSAAVALAGACAPEPSAEEQERQAARAVAMVEAAQKQHPPLQPLEPEPFERAELAEAGLSLEGCAFLARERVGDEAVFFAGNPVGTLKVGGRFARFAADAGSARIAAGAVSQYVGKAYALRLFRSGDPVAMPGGMQRWPAVLTVRDAWERVAYKAHGVLECGAPARGAAQAVRRSPIHRKTSVA